MRAHEESNEERPDGAADSDTEEKQHTFQVELPEDDLEEALKAVERREAAAKQSGEDADEMVRELEERLEAAEKQAQEWKDKYLRTAADFENLRKRALRDREEARLYGAESLLRDLLVVLDNMERAIDAAGEAEQIREGVKLTHDQFKHILGQHGVEVIEAAGGPFDPAHHEAVAHVPSPEHDAGTIIEEHRRGYRYRERLLRPTMVSVAKEVEGDSQAGNPEAASEAQAEGAKE